MHINSAAKIQKKSDIQPDFLYLFLKSFPPFDNTYGIGLLPSAVGPSAEKALLVQRSRKAFAFEINGITKSDIGVAFHFTEVLLRLLIFDKYLEEYIVQVIQEKSLSREPRYPVRHRSHNVFCVLHSLGLGKQESDMRQTPPPVPPREVQIVYRCCVVWVIFTVMHPKIVDFLHPINVWHESRQRIGIAEFAKQCTTGGQLTGEHRGVAKFHSVADAVHYRNQPSRTAVLVGRPCAAVSAP